MKATHRWTGNAAKRLLLTGVLGGLGGALNASLCLLKIPSAAGASDFSAWIVPAGCLHGLLLALIPLACAMALWTKPLGIRVLGLPAAGWLAGWWSFIPLQLYITSQNYGGELLGARQSPSLTLRNLFDALVWPFQGRGREILWMPWTFFGAVALMCYGGWCLCRVLSARALWRHLVVAVVGAGVGSFWWWQSWQPWYFSLLHGTMWGSLVGYGTWRLAPELSSSHRQTASHHLLP